MNASKIIKSDYFLALGFSQPLAFQVDVVIDNTFITGLVSSAVSVLSIYFYHKFKK